MASSPESVACLRHPGRQTLLRCGKCGDPICPRCLIQTPVGARCPRCVTYQRNPLTQVSALLFVRAMGAGLATALVGGFLWALVSGYLLMGFFSLLLGIGLGYLVGLAVSASANRSQARSLQVLAGSGAALAFLLAGGLNPFLGVQSPVGLFAALLAVVAAVSAVR